MADIELSNDQIELEENPYEKPSVTSDKNQKSVLMADAAVSTVSSGGDLVQTMEDLSQSSADEMRTNATIGEQARQSQLLSDTIEITAVEQPEQLEKVVTAAPSRVAEIDAMASSKLTPYMAWVNSLEGSERLSEDEKKSIAIDSLFWEGITKGLDERAWYETAHDFLGMMAVPDESYNAAAIEAEILGETVGFKEWLNSASAYKNLASFRQNLSPSERVMFDERLTEVIQGVDDNVIQQVQAAMAIMGRDPDTEAWQAMEKFDAGVIGSGLGLAFFRGLKTMNVLNRTAKAKDARATQKTADAVVADPAVAKATGVEPMNAASVGNPVRPRGIFTGAPDGLQKEYRMYASDVSDALNKASEVLSITARPNTKDADEIAASVKRNLAKNDDIDNIKTRVKQDGITIEYDILDGDSVVTKQEFRGFTVDDLGTFQQQESGLVGSGLRFATSPNTLAGKDRDFFVQQAEVATYAKGRLNKSFSEAVDLALKPVNGNKKSLQKLDVVLKQLDGTDTKINYQTMVHEGVGGQRLNDKEFIALVGLRRVLDDAWFTNNQVVRREMELRGSKSVKIGDDVNYAKPYNDAESAYTVYSGDTDNIHILDPKGFTHKAVGLDELQKFYNDGKVLVRSDNSDPQSWFTSPDGFVRYALVNKADVSELPRQVLNKVPNYLPKLREDANFFIKNKREMVVDGVKKKKDVSVAYAATRSQAERYLQRLQKTAEEAGEGFSPDDWEIRFDREVSSGSVNGDSIAVTGGLIRGKRKSTELDFAGDLDEGGRTDALDSLQRYMAITADKVAMSEWRLSARHQVQQEASMVADIGDKALRTDWKGLRGEIEASSMKPQRKAKLLGMYDQTSTMSMIPTKTDQAFQGFVRAVGEKFDKAGQEKVAKYFYHMHDKSLVDLIKGTTFNLTLGTFNLVQIPVQLLGASVAMSINPRAATSAAPRWLMSSTLDFVTNEKVAQKYLNKIAKDLEVDSKTLANDYAAWRKSGMYEAVVRGNADAASIANRLPYDAGFLRRGFTRAIELGQTPYRMGELANMRISFFTALEREKALKGKSFKYNDETIQRVVGRAEQYRLNMSAANKAGFQKGIWALPTQFKQIYTKYLESLTGSHFNGKEKASLILGQAALFGTAGIPMLDYTMDKVGTDVFGFDNEALTAEQLTAVRRGALGWLINDQLDIDALISGRLTVNADILGELNTAFFDTKTPFIATALGASYLTGDKSIDFVKNMTFAGGLVLDAYLEGEEMTPVVKEAAAIMVRSTAGLASSTRKWMAAVDLNNGWVKKSDGTLLYSTEPDLADIYARAVGFGSQEMDDLYKLSLAERKSKTKVSDMANRYIATIYDLNMYIESGSEVGTEAAQIAASMITDQIRNLDPAISQEVFDLVHRRIGKPRDFKEKTIRDAILNNYGELTQSANKLSILKQKFIEENELE